MKEKIENRIKELKNRNGEINDKLNELSAAKNELTIEGIENTAVIKELERIVGDK